MAKRKRDARPGAVIATEKPPTSDGYAKQGKPVPQGGQKKHRSENGEVKSHVEESVVEDEEKANVHTLDADTTTIQIITGSYERVLHGFIATIPRGLITGQDTPKKDGPDQQEPPKIEFSDTFLFNAHTSAIRCIALSPHIDSPDGNGKIFLATGSTDQRINLYQISSRPPAVSRSKPKLPTLHGSSITENRRNKELGSLLHHEASITALYFPSRSKLMSAAEDCHLAIVRTRDWVPLSTIKAPIPLVQGRPSGDTAAHGEVPSGINDFSVHPSMKLMVSVSKGEKSMRLWNLLTGKKAGVLTFSREILNVIGEGRFGIGEGRKVEWDASGEEFTVAFERGAVVFGIDCKPTATIVPSPRTKLHQMKYLPNSTHLLALSTEDGRIIIYDTKKSSLTDTQIIDGKESKKLEAMPSAFIAQIGGPAAGISGRIKEFEIHPFATPDDADASIKYIFITGSSDGSVRLWLVDSAELVNEAQPHAKIESTNEGFSTKQVGTLIGTYSTGTRITCLASFVMSGEPEEDEPLAIRPTDKDDEKSEESSSDDDSD